jgi:hypothetical protein
VPQLLRSGSGGRATGLDNICHHFKNRWYCINKATYITYIGLYVMVRTEADLRSKCNKTVLDGVTETGHLTDSK